MNRKIKIISIANKEKGQALLITLVLLLIGSIMIPALLSFMTSGLRTGQVYKQRTNLLYAADSGIEDAIWQLNQSQNVTTEWYYLTEAVNNCNVRAKIEYIDATPSYYITAEATAADNTATTIVTKIVDGAVDLSDVLQQVLTSTNGYTVQGGQSSVSPAAGEPHGPIENYAGQWATADELSDYYLRYVDTDAPYSSDTIDLSTTTTLDDTYVNGPLEIINSSGDTYKTLTLNGTLYVTGDTLIGQTNTDFILDLNNQAIFVASDTLTYALQVGDKCHIVGSGAIVVVGGSQFMPNLDSGSTDYLYLMSVLGQSHIKPNGTFYGTVAGNSVWDQGATITWSDPTGKTLNIPGVGPPLWTKTKWDIQN